MNIPKKKVYKNGATLIYRKRNRKCTSVIAGFVFGKNRDNYPEPTAHFLEHMFFKATEKKNEKQLRQAQLDTFSSMENGRTNLFYTEIDFCRSDKALSPCFELASEMLLKTKFNPKSVETEKGVIKQELVRKLNNPDAVFRYANLRTTRTDYNKTTMVLGSEEEIDAINAKGLKKFRDEMFVSQNFVIAIEGGISYFKAKRLAEKYFIKKLKSNPNMIADKNISLPINREGNLNVERFNFKKAICKITIKIDKEYETTKNKQIMEFLRRMSNGISGKLLGSLRDKGLVYGGNLSWQSIPEYSIFASFNCSIENVNKCIDVIGKVFDDYRKTPVEKQLIDKIKENDKLEKDEKVSSIYPSNLFSNYLVEKEENFFSKKYIKACDKAFESITPKDIQEFCQKVLSKPENIYVTILSGESDEKFYTYEEIQSILTQNKKPKK